MDDLGIEAEGCLVSNKVDVVYSEVTVDTEEAAYFDDIVGVILKSVPVDDGVDLSVDTRVV